MVFTYLRVSSESQSLQRQRVAIESYVKENNITIDKTFEDKKSGKDFISRENYMHMREQLRKGDILIIKELDRLGRSYELIKDEWDYLTRLGVEIIIIDTPLLNTSNKSDLEKQLIANIVFELYSYISEKQRLKIKQTQAEGIAIAKEQKKYQGRQPICINEKEFKELYTKWKSKEITAKSFMQQIKLDRGTFYNRIKMYESTGSINIKK